MFIWPFLYGIRADCEVCRCTCLQEVYMASWDILAPAKLPSPDCSLGIFCASHIYIYHTQYAIYHAPYVIHQTQHPIHYTPNAKRHVPCMHILCFAQVLRSAERRDSDQQLQHPAGHAALCAPEHRHCAAGHRIVQRHHLPQHRLWTSGRHPGGPSILCIFSIHTQ